MKLLDPLLFPIRPQPIHSHLPNYTHPLTTTQVKTKVPDTRNPSPTTPPHLYPPTNSTPTTHQHPTTHPPSIPPLQTSHYKSKQKDQKCANPPSAPTAVSTYRTYPSPSRSPPARNPKLKKPGVVAEKKTWWGCGQHIPSVMDAVAEEERCGCEPRVEVGGRRYPPKGAQP